MIYFPLNDTDIKMLFYYKNVTQFVMLQSTFYLETYGK